MPRWASPPALWGDYDHVRHLFGGKTAALELRPGTYTERIPGGPAGYCGYYKKTFGLVAAIYAALTPARPAAADRDFLAFAEQHNAGREGGPAELEFQIVRVIAPHRQPLTTAVQRVPASCLA